MAAGVPDRGFDDPWDTLVRQLQAPEAPTYYIGPRTMLVSACLGSGHFRCRMEAGLSMTPTASITCWRAVTSGAAWRLAWA